MTAVDGVPQAALVPTAQEIPPKPVAIPVNPDSIPETLRQYPQWVIWRHEWMDGKSGQGKWGKKAFAVKSGRKCEYFDWTAWVGFDEAFAAYRSGSYEGVGIAFHKGQSLVGIGVDNTINPEKGIVEPWALEILEAFRGTYIEKSPSGTGFRIFCWGKPEFCGRGKGTIRECIEVDNYSSSGFLAVTGHSLDRNPLPVTDQQAALDWLDAEYFQPREAPSSPSKLLPVTFTQFQSSSTLSKTFALVEGKIEKTPVAHMVAGKATSIEIDFLDFAEALGAMGPNNAMAYGLHDKKKYGNPAMIVVKKAAQPPYTIPRSKDYFKFRAGPGILFIDFDPSEWGRKVKPDELLAILASIFQPFASAACWIRGSVSAGVHRTGQPPQELPSFHLYFAVPDASDIHRFVETLFDRLWLGLEGYIALARNGNMLLRTLVDKTVCSGEHMDFVGKPVINGDGLAYTPPKARWREGGYLPTAELPGLSTVERRELARIIAEAKAKVKPEAVKAKHDPWVDEKVEEMVANGTDRAEARAQVERITSGKNINLPLDFVLALANGKTVTVAELLADPDTFDGEAMADPIEGTSYGASTAVFFANTAKGKPLIHSFAHGGMTYFLSARSKPAPNCGGLDGDTPEDGAGDGMLVFADSKGGLHLIIESEAAILVARWMKDEFAHNAGASAWHRFTGTHWQPVEKSEPAARAAGLLFKETRPCGFTVNYLNNIIRLIITGDMLPLPGEPVGKIPFTNGLLDMATGMLEPTHQQNAATWCIPHDYVPGADCPRFKAWLLEALHNDGGLVELLRAFINACLFGRADLQKFLNLFGPGGTGKSAFLRILRTLLGPENCATTDLKNLEQNRFEAATMYGKRLASITDAGRYTGSVDTLKAMTGGDALRNERKHEQQNGTFVFEGMVIIASNEHLAATDYTSGLDRRRMVVKFGKRYTEDEKARFSQRGGEEALQAEIPAIVNWALELGRDEVTRIFAHPPKACVESSNEAQRAQNPVAEWVDDNLGPAPGNWCGIGVKKEVRGFHGPTQFEDADGKLYPNYLRWCSENGRLPMSLNRFRETVVDTATSMGIDAAALLCQDRCRLPQGECVSL